MSTENQEKKGRVESVNLNMKLMEVGSNKYHIDMKQNGESRFYRIVENHTGGRSQRVVVPMCSSQDFCNKLYDVLSFASTYTPKNISERKNSQERMVFAHSVSLITPGGRRYYFDIVDAENSLNLRISYVIPDQRDSIHIAVEALPNLLQILEEYQKKYPSLSPTDDYPSRSRSRYNNDKRGGSSRGYRGQGRYRSRGFTSNRGMSTRTVGEIHSNSNDSTEFKRPTALKVLSEPSPVHISKDAKKYTFEIVEGSNTFLRITEMINERRKFTLHVPIEMCSQIQTIIGDMNKRFSTISKSSTAASSTYTTAK